MSFTLKKKATGYSHGLHYSCPPPTETEFFRKSTHPAASAWGAIAQLNSLVQQHNHALVPLKSNDMSAMDSTGSPLFYPYHPDHCSHVYGVLPGRVQKMLNTEASPAVVALFVFLATWPIDLSSLLILDLTTNGEQSYWFSRVLPGMSANLNVHTPLGGIAVMKSMFDAPRENFCWRRLYPTFRQVWAQNTVCLKHDSF